MNTNPMLWPKWATEPVNIENYNNEWPILAKSLIEELKELYQFEATYFEHIGSTSVSGLPAKPVIDIIYPLENFLLIDNLVTALKRNDWHLIPPELDDKRDYSRTFVKVVNDRRHAHFHLILSESGDYELKKRFRDLLRINPLLVKEYSELKYHLAEKCRNDREAYTKAKSNFIASSLNKNI
jgi:GrpB-like predicted nucleotidyltransferase (UPF0157 family)